MKKALLTGASGQLGQCFELLSSKYPDLQIEFLNSVDLDLTQFAVVEKYLRDENFDFCINCAAYTNVEKAEKERELAYIVNAEAVKNLAQACTESECTLVHFSTDYVFDGQKRSPYQEDDMARPINVYGASKLQGENHIVQEMTNYYIFRVSWLYSDLGNNFYKTILKRAETGEKLGITTSQRGTPTNAYDLADAVLTILASEQKQYGTYHFSNMGEATWFDFAEEIIKHLKTNSVLDVDNTYRTLAARPEYSVLDKTKFTTVFSIPILSWRDSLSQLF